MTQRTVTEFDLRAPEFKHPGVRPEDLEFRKDGKIVRKDRWETAVFRIAQAMGFSSREGFEIDDVVAAVEQRVLPPGWSLQVNEDAGGNRLDLVYDGIVSSFAPTGGVGVDALARLKEHLE